MLYEITHGTASRGGSPILSDFNFYIRGTEKIAVVGRNGAGKTTLLDVIGGGLPLERDDHYPGSGIRTARNLTVGMLSQQPDIGNDVTVDELIRESYRNRTGTVHETTEHRMPETSSDAETTYSSEYIAYEQRFLRMFTGFGFRREDRAKTFGTFSGGEQKKIQLIRLLLDEPDVLLLDEPTNHLDIRAVERLERYLKKYPRAVVMVSHDRWFIDHACEVVWEISHGRLTRYSGGYTAYREQKKLVYEKQMAAWEAQQEEIARLGELIEKFRHKPKKAAFARSRRKILERMERVEKPIADDAVIHTGDILPERRGNKWVYTCEDLVIGYDRGKPVRKLNLKIRRGQKIGVIGPNGSGKSTFLRTIAGKLAPLAGKQTLGDTIDPAYFDQFSARLTDEKPVMDFFHDRFPALTEKEIRDTLAGYLFRGADLAKPVAALSGGEKARLTLAVLLERKPNLLVLDEPTNNMDIPVMESLESIFQSYRGTILFVSHDRYFLRQVADALLVFPDSLPGGEEDEVCFYPFGYEHYAGQKGLIDAGLDPAAIRSAKEQKMIEELRAVPKKSYLPHALSASAMERDYDCRMNAEALSAAEEQYLKAAGIDSEEASEPAGELTGADAAQSEETGADSGHMMTLEEYMNSQDEPENPEEVKRAEDAWTKELTDWYDLWLEDHD